MAVTYSSNYTGPGKFHGNTADTDHPNLPEIVKHNTQLSTDIQTALTAGFGANAGTLATAEGNITTNATNITTLSTAYQVRVPLTLTANDTWATYVDLSKASTVTGFAVTTPTAFASTGGAVTLAIKKDGSGGNTMLNAATYDLEGVSANTRTALTVTGTGADLGIAANGLIYIAIVSDNADATGPAASAAILTINYTVTMA